MFIRFFILLNILGTISSADDPFFSHDEFSLEAIFADCALINSKWICINESINGAKLISITNKRAVLDGYMGRFSLSLKKDAKPKDEI